MATTAATLRRTNEQPGTRAKLTGLRTSAFKVREVLDLIRGEDVARANEILTFCNRGSAEPVQKLLNSAIANAGHNDQLSPEELFVSACFADEGPTMKRVKFVGHGRTGRIRKRSSSVTIIVARLPEDRLERLRSAQAKNAPQSSRRRRVSTSRADRVAKSQTAAEEVEVDETPVVEEVITDEATEETTPVEVSETEVPAQDEAAKQTEEEK